MFGFSWAGTYWGASSWRCMYVCFGLAGHFWQKSRHRIFFFCLQHLISMYILVPTWNDHPRVRILYSLMSLWWDGAVSERHIIRWTGLDLTHDGRACCPLKPGWYLHKVPEETVPYLILLQGVSTMQCSYILSLPNQTSSCQQVSGLHYISVEYILAFLVFESSTHGTVGGYAHIS